MGYSRTLIAYNGYGTGLGNRIRVTLGAANLAAAENRAFFYVWPRGKRFGPRMQDLWTWSEGRRVSRAASRVLGVATGYLGHELANLTPEMRKAPVLQIRTSNILTVPDGVKTWERSLRELAPVAHIADRVRRFFDQCLAGHPFVGVQIRAHAVSHPRTRDASPVEWYVRRMREMTLAHPDIRFFVSCDVPTVKRQIMDEFSNAVALHHEAPYNSTAAVQGAVCDLYLLAASSYILGPYYSSFVEMAEHLADGAVPSEKAHQRVPDLSWTDVPAVLDPLRPSERAWRSLRAHATAATSATATVPQEDLRMA